MLTEYTRDAAMVAVIFGFFGMVWFGWAQEDPPKRWRAWLAGGSILSVLTAIAGGLLAWQHWGDGSAFDRETSPIFGIIVGIEFGVAAIGALLLTLVFKRREFVAPWVAFVVGVHLFPVAALIGYPLVHVAAALVTVVSILAIPVARKSALAPSAVTGLGTGVSLLVVGLISLAVALTL